MSGMHFSGVYWVDDRVNSLARLLPITGMALCSAALWAGAPDAPQASSFAWRGTLALPAGASLVQVELPLQALLHMQSSVANDVRVFNAAGAAVPFALLGGADTSGPAPTVQTRSYNAYPLFGSNSPGKDMSGAVEVRVDNSGQHSRAWVRWDSTTAKPSAADPSAEPLQAALFDTRGETQTLDALMLATDLPHNALTPIAAASSANLKDWTALATQGPLFQFDGADAPANTTLALQQPLMPKDRYLRLTWVGQAGVKVMSLTGRVAILQTVPAPLRAALAPGMADGTDSLSWTLPFATPMAALHLQAVRDNTLVPVRILGRGDAAQPWRTLASSVVYRLDSVGQGNSNPPTPLQGASMRGLRV